ncbi:MAG: hypothetical protein RDU01_06290 [Thermodesulfovibrionales bacterium]|nr:hypothetical protein [Thermodesulfovibrionales bacterium]
MNELSKNESATTAEEINQLIENIKSDLNLHENAEKFVKAVDKNQLAQKEDYKPLLKSFCNVLRAKGYPIMAENFAEQWHIQS